MDRGRLERVRMIFDEAADAAPDRRAEVVASRCQGDEALRAEVESLLAAHQAAERSAAGGSGYLETPAVEMEALRSAAEGDEWLDDAEALVGTRLGRYLLGPVLGRGGMGVVYRAEQEHPRRAVAVKVIRSALASREIVRRFEHEAAVLARLKHPGIAQVYEAGSARTATGRVVPFIAMELVEGSPLMVHVERQALGVASRLALLAEVCDAVEHAHKKGVIHRDLKPANILVESGAGEAARAKVMDFGVARVVSGEAGGGAAGMTMQTEAGQVIGTLAYMSPEQVRGASHEVDTRSDVYALGVIGFEVMTGRLPVDVRGKGVAEAARLVTESEPARAGQANGALRGDIETVLGMALEKSPGRRYQSAAELGADLRRIVAGEPISARPPTTAYLVRKLVQRHRGLSVVLGVLVASTVLFGVAMAGLYRRAEHQREEAVAARERAAQEAETSLAVARFMGDVFERARGVRPGDETKSALDMLNAATAHMDTKPPGKPEVAAALYCAVSEAYDNLGQTDKADRYLRMAEPLVKQLSGERTIRYLNILGDLIDHARKMGRIEEGRAMLKRYAEIHQEIFGEATGRHSDMAAENTAMLAWEMGELTVAAPIYERVLAAARSDEGVQDVLLARVLNNYAGVLADMERFAEAEVLVREALAIWEKSTAIMAGPKRGSSLNNLAWVVYRQGRLEEAERLAREALEWQRSIFGPEHVLVASCATTLGAVLEARGRAEEALPLLGHSLRVRQSRLPGDSDLTAETRRLMSRALLAAGDVRGARALLVEAIAALGQNPRGLLAMREAIRELRPISARLGMEEEEEALGARLRDLEARIKGAGVSDGGGVPSHAPAAGRDASER